MASIASSLSAGNATQIKNDHLAMPIAATEYSFALQSGCKFIEIFARHSSNLKFAWVAGETVTNYRSVKKNVAWSIQGMSLIGVILYVQSDQANEILEITQLY